MVNTPLGGVTDFDQYAAVAEYPVKFGNPGAVYLPTLPPFRKD